MAEFDKQLPQWDKTGTEPPESKRINGWVAGDKPPAIWLNWFFNLIYKAVQQLQQFAQHKSEKGASNGYASLDSDGLLPLNELTLHSDEHATGGLDPLTPADIGAETPTGAQTKADAVQTVMNGRLRGPVADIAALKAINTTGFTDTILVGVKANGIYRYDAGSVAAGDDDLIVTPTTGNGRWYLLISHIGKSVTSRDTDTHKLVKGAAGILGHFRVGTGLSVDADGILSATSTAQDLGNNPEFLRMYRQAVKQVAIFQGDEAWVLGAGVQSADNVNVKLGGQSLKLAENGSVARQLYTTLQFVQDMSQFDGPASATSDYIRFSFYVSDSTKVDPVNAGVRLIFWTNDIQSQYFDYKVNVVTTGWNHVDILKSDFTSASGNWATIKSVQVGWFSLANASGVYVSFQYVGMIKKDPSAAYPNQFQHKENNAYVRDFAIDQTNNCKWFLGYNFGMLVAKPLNSLNTTSVGIEASLKGTKGYSGDFFAEATFVCGMAQNMYGLMWEIDSNNRISCGVYSNSFSNIIYKAGVLDGAQISTPFVALLGNTYKMRMVKKGTTVTVSILCIEDGTHAELTAETSLVGTGYLTVNTYSAGNHQMKSVSITSIEHADTCNTAEFARQLSTENIRFSNFPINAAVAQFDFPSGYKAYDIDFVIRCSTATPRDLWITFNGTNANAHNQHTIKQNGTTITGINQSPSDSAMIILNGAPANAVAYSQGHIHINNSGIYQSIHAEWMTYITGTLYESYHSVEQYAGSVTGINSIIFTCLADAIAAGSTIRITGVK